MKDLDTPIETTTGELTAVRVEVNVSKVLTKK